jgi:hypothetical protein
MTESFKPSRDIRNDLMERLREASAKQERYSALAAEAAFDMDMLQRMIEREEVRYRLPAQIAAEPDLALPEFVFKALQVRPMTKDDLRHSVENAGYRVDGRSIHATIVNLLRGNKIMEIAEGVYEAAKEAEVR